MERRMGWDRNCYHLDGFESWKFWKRFLWTIECIGRIKNRFGANKVLVLNDLKKQKRQIIKIVKLIILTISIYFIKENGEKIIVEAKTNAFKSSNENIMKVIEKPFSDVERGYVLLHINNLIQLLKSEGEWN